MFISYFICLLITVPLVKTCVCQGQGTVEVKFGEGLLSGKVHKTFLNEKVYYAFEGIPYAEPPVGELRFKPPRPHPGWSHLYEAYKSQPTCVQFNSRTRNGEKFGLSGSEDCLYLSVFTPSLKGSRPVLVFDYNDNYRTGYNGTKTYSPAFFAEEDVVVVTLNHRLGLLGYLTTEDDVIPSNNGIRDFILALKWIKEHIKKFGGDPDRVTLMGCKGGGSLVNNLLYSKAAKGLFHAATIQGGTAHEAIYFPKNPRAAAFKLAELLEIQAEDSTTLLKELQSMDYEAIIAREGEVEDFESSALYQMNIHPFTPVLEEKEGPDAIITVLPENGEIVNDVPILIGFNSRDGLDLNSLMLVEPKILNEVNHEIAIHFPIRANFRFDRNSSAFGSLKEEIINYYLEDGYLNYNNILEYSVYVGDVLQNYALNKAARKISKEQQSPTFIYLFDFNGMLNENTIYLARRIRSGLKNWGATATDEICHLHLCSRIRGNYEELKKLVTEQNEIRVLRKMVRLWSNFAKTGNPTPEETDDVLKTFKWKPVDKTSDNLAYLHITKSLKMKTNPMGDREKFWDRILEKYSQMAVDGIVQDEKPHDEL